MTDILAVKEDVKRGFLEKPNVVGVGVGYKIKGGEQTDELAVVALVEKKKPLSALALGDRLPILAQGAPVDVVEVGRIDALSYTSRERPAQPGISIGHYQITAGTFGAVVLDKLTGEELLLSNNHVFANTNEANIGDPILQPGYVDGGRTPEDQIATLLRFVPIDFGIKEGECPYAETYARASNFLSGVLGSKHKVKVIKQDTVATNYVDCAVARPLNETLYKKEIRDIGIVEGWQDYYLGMEVHKTGRTTEHTEGKISMVNATVTVNYGGEKQAVFDDQLISGYMSQGGDSGSLLVSKETNKAVGLLYAGSSQATIYNPIERVLNQLRIRI